MQSSHRPRDPAARPGRWILEQSRGKFSCFSGAGQRKRRDTEIRGSPSLRGLNATDWKCQLPSRYWRAVGKSLEQPAARLFYFNTAKLNTCTISQHIHILMLVVIVLLLGVDILLARIFLGEIRILSISARRFALALSFAVPGTPGGLSWETLIIYSRSLQRI